MSENKSWNINKDRAFNQWTSIKNDSCSYENYLRLGAMPMRYYVNDFNSPQVDPFDTYTVVGNMKQFNVRNDFERPLPSRLNPIYQTYVTPYPTTPNLANQAENRTHTNTGTELRFGDSIRPLKSSVSIAERDYNRWEPGVDAYTVQNAGQFQSGAKLQGGISRNGYVDPLSQNNVMFANGAFNRNGISTRNELHNFVDLECESN